MDIINLHTVTILMSAPNFYGIFSLYATKFLIVPLHIYNWVGYRFQSKTSIL